MSSRSSNSSVTGDNGGSSSVMGARPERGNDTGRNRAGEAERVADRDHELSHPQVGGVTQLSGLKTAVLGAQYGEI